MSPAEALAADVRAILPHDTAVVLQLDSAVIPEREDAHRLYFNSGMRITSYHFGRKL